MILLASLFSYEELSANFSVSGISNQQQKVTGIVGGYSAWCIGKLEEVRLVQPGEEKHKGGSLPPARGVCREDK